MFILLFVLCFTDSSAFLSRERVIPHARICQIMQSVEEEKMHRDHVYSLLFSRLNNVHSGGRPWQTPEINQYATNFCPSMFSIDNVEENLKALLGVHKADIQSEFEQFVLTGGRIDRDLRMRYTYHNKQYSSKIMGQVYLSEDRRPTFNFDLKMYDDGLLFRDAGLFIPGAPTKALQIIRHQCIGWT